MFAKPRDEMLLEQGCEVAVHFGGDEGRSQFGKLGG